MTVEQARCITHPDSNADSHCPRCGSFVCPACVPNTCPWVCIPCRSQLKLATESVYLDCLSCNESMEAGYVQPISPLHFLSFAGFKKYFNWPTRLTNHGLKLFFEEMTTWGNSWLRIDRCTGCRHVLVDYGNYYFTGAIKKRRKAGEGAHETPWKSTGECPLCKQRVLIGYLVRTYPASFRSYEDFDRFFLWGYKSLGREGIPLGEFTRQTFKLGSFFSTYHHPIYRCEDCRYVVLRYWEVQTRTEIMRLAKEAGRYQRGLDADAS